MEAELLQAVLGQVVGPQPGLEWGPHPLDSQCLGEVRGRSVGE